MPRNWRSKMRNNRWEQLWPTPGIIHCCKVANVWASSDLSYCFTSAVSLCQALSAMPESWKRVISQRAGSCLNRASVIGVTGNTSPLFTIYMTRFSGIALSSANGRKYDRRLIKVRTRPKVSDFTAMDEARSWSELLSAIIYHFGTSIPWHIGMARQYDVQWDTTSKNEHSTRQASWYVDLPQVDSLIFLVMARCIGTIKNWKGKKSPEINQIYRINRARTGTAE